MIQLVALQIDFPHAIKYSYAFISSSLRNHSHFINFGQYANGQQNVNKVKYMSKINNSSKSQAGVLIINECNLHLHCFGCCFGISIGVAITKKKHVQPEMWNILSIYFITATELEDGNEWHNLLCIHTAARRKLGNFRWCFKSESTLSLFVVFVF